MFQWSFNTIWKLDSVVGLFLYLSLIRKMTLNTKSVTYWLGPLSKNYYLDTIYLAAIRWKDRNTKFTLLLDFNMIAYEKGQVHTKLLFILTLSF